MIPRRLRAPKYGWIALIVVDAGQAAVLSPSRSANDEQTPNPVGRQGHLRAIATVIEGPDEHLAPRLVHQSTLRSRQIEAVSEDDHELGQEIADTFDAGKVEARTIRDASICPLHPRDDPLPVLEREQQSPLNLFEGHERQLVDQLVNKRPEPTGSNHAPRTPRTPSKPPKRRTKGRAERSRTSSRLNCKITHRTPNPRVS